MVKFIKKDDGLVTIEWVGIAAVMVLAAIAVTTMVMNGTSATSTAVRGDIDAATGMLSGTAPTYAPPVAP